MRGISEQQMVEESRAEDLSVEITQELKKARAKHVPMHSPHEGYSVILEELDELWDEVKKQKPDKKAMRKEAKQVGAMAMRFILDLLEDTE